MSHKRGRKEKSRLRSDVTAPHIRGSREEGGVFLQGERA